MKKFMTAIFACVCASVGFAEKDTFDDKEVGAFTTSGNWVVASGTDATIAQDAEGSSRNKYLAIADAENHNSIYRAYNIPSGSASPEETTVPATGLYFDSYVKFTVSDTLSPTAIDDTNAKIAVYAYCDDDAEPLVTNLVACAGFYDTTSKQVVTTNYVLTSTNINADTWYRLTIKTFKFSDETTVGRYGFVVYLNGEPLSYAEGVTTGYTDFTATAQKYANNHQLLPSLQDGDQTVKQTITKTSFIGTGAVDDVDWTATTPTGIPADDILITLKWDDGISALKFGDESIKIDDTTKTTNIVVAAGTETKEITATAKTGYEFDGWTNGNYVVNVATTYEVKTYESIFTVDGTSYKDLKTALRAAIDEGKTLKLVKDLAVGKDCIDATTDSGKNTLIIDLAGHNITCEGGTHAIFLTKCNLVVTNSTTTVGKIEAGSEGSVYTEDEDEDPRVVVYDYCQFEGDIAINAQTNVVCYGGIFKKGSNTKFPYTCADGYKSTDGDTDGYWKVVEGEETKDSPVDPGSTTDCGNDKDKADALAKEINDAKSTMINAPAELTDDTQKTAYCNLFEAKVVNGTSGYSVVVDFTTTSSNELQTAVNDVETKVNLPALATADQTAEVAAKPGLWYTVYVGEETPATLEAKSSTQATENTLNLTFPKSTNGTRGFYKVGVSIKKVDVSAETTSGDTVQ